MQFEALKVFCDIARLRSFSKAAEANDLTQSAASQIVHTLEKRLQGQLIDRSTRPLQLTPMGQVYYEGCRKLVEQYLELEASILQGQARYEACTEVAAIYSVGIGDLGHLVEQLKAAQPGARVHVEYLHPDQVYQKVLDGAADLGLISFPQKLRELVVVPWREEEMVLACPLEHPLARQASIAPEMLQGVVYVAFHHDLRIRRQVDLFLRRQGVGVQVECEFDNIENIKRAIIDGKTGVALLPEPTLRAEVQAGTLVARPLRGCRLARPLAIIYRRQHALSSCARRFIDLLLEDTQGTSDTVKKRTRVPTQASEGRS